jgi:hypothetical protein
MSNKLRNNILSSVPKYLCRSCLRQRQSMPSRASASARHQQSRRGPVRMLCVPWCARVVKHLLCHVR